MARTAIISDIHSNLHALSAVMEDAWAMKCTDVVCLGDIVGYNAYPRECLDYIRELNCPVVKGNHDEEVVSPSLIRMNPVARQAMDWTREQLDEDRLNWLGRLQYRRFVKPDYGMSYSIVHASLDQPKAWNYIFNDRDSSTHFKQQTTQLCFHGHSHSPRIFYHGGGFIGENTDLLSELEAEGYAEFQPHPELKYLINVGSVGQPRDADPRACYVIYDTELSLIIFKRVSYNIEEAQHAVRAAGLPDYLAERLARGC
ncbi:MAG: metallophosphoesterase family protein [Akkermansiaceae bacterium]|nr:metallophosphoesterase family protein [Akkermansiaceae bacterium]